MLSKLGQRASDVYTSTVNNLKHNGWFFNIIFILIIVMIIFLTIMKDDQGKLELFYAGSYDELYNKNLNNLFKYYIKENQQAINQEIQLSQQSERINDLIKKLQF